MTPVFQTNTTKGQGNCMQAAFATLFDLDLDQVPNFIKYSENQWFKVFRYFVESMGYPYNGCRQSDYLKEGPNVNGYVKATVPSRTHGGEVTHSVIIDTNGLVVHDPNPNKLWLGENIVESGEMYDWWVLGYE